ncbi:hypothetical protein P7K49_024604, partial [Saguinus oedipus]
EFLEDARRTQDSESLGGPGRREKTPHSAATRSLPETALGRRGSQAGNLAHMLVGPRAAA